MMFLKKELVLCIEYVQSSPEVDQYVPGSDRPPSRYYNTVVVGLCTEVTSGTVSFSFFSFEWE